MEEFKQDEVIEEVMVQDKDINGFLRLWMMVVAPIDALKAIRKRPNLLIPMIIVPLLPLLYYVLCWDVYETQLIQMLEAQMASMGQELTPELIDFQINLTKYATPIGAVVGVLLGVLISAAIYFGLLRLFKSPISFKQTFSMLINIGFVSSLLWVFHILMTYIVGDSNILEPATSLASLLPSGYAGTLTYAIASTVELFSIWYLILLYFGFKVVGQISTKKAAILVGGTYIVTLSMAAISFALTNISSIL